MYKEILGYDIRFDHKNCLDIWGKDRRNDYLFKPDIPLPSSVDSIVWPSIFLYSGDIPVYDFNEVILLEPKNPRQAALKLWSNLEEMINEFKKGKKECGIIVGIEVFSEAPLKSQEWWSAVLYPEEVLPSKCPNNWVPIGYDVASRDMFSALSNCKYPELEEKALKQYWSKYINEYGLLTTLESAIEFRELAEKNVPEHKPFLIYNIYRDPNLLCR